MVCYFDGFGIGSDEDQRRLLQRIAGWLTENGCALIDVLTPWYWSSQRGATYELGDVVTQDGAATGEPGSGGVVGRFDFDAEGCRMVGRMHRKDVPEEVVFQTLRRYSPADLRLLLEGTGFVLSDIEPFDNERYERVVPLPDAMLYLARLARA